MKECHRIRKAVWKRCPLKNESEIKLINGDRYVLYKKIPIQGLCRQLQFANVNDDASFRLGHCWELEACVHHVIELQLFLDIFKVRRIKLMYSEKKDVVWNEIKGGREKSFLWSLKYLLIRQLQRRKAQDWLYILFMLCY